MKTFVVCVQQWENEKCGPNNVLSKFKYSLHKDQASAWTFIKEYQQKRKVTRINDTVFLSVDEKTYNKVVNQHKKGKPFTANKFGKIDLYSFS